MTTPNRPVLRYHGGKWRLAPWIISHFPQHKVYVELFGGAASVLLRKKPVYAEVYNDLDSGVVNVFRVLRNPELAKALQRSIELTPFSREEHKIAYEPTSDPVESARRMIYRSYAGLGTDSVFVERGFRSSTKRNEQAITVAYDWSSYPAQITNFVRRLRSVIIENRDWRIIADQHDGPNTLFYVDPPYVTQTRSGDALYNHEMTDDDHRQLADVLRRCAGAVIISGYACDLYDNELYPDWQRIERMAYADGARQRTEVLWISPNVHTHQPNLI